MRDYGSLKDLYLYIHDAKNGGCERCEEQARKRCYAPTQPALLFSTSEKTDIMLISESPYNYPNEEVKSSDDFTRVELDCRLKMAARNGKPPESAPKDIFEFIYHVFRPIFQADQQGWPDRLLRNVYWTHVGKKSFKGLSTRRRSECASQCASRLLIQELQAIEPKLLIIASSVASRVLLGKGFTELLEEQKDASGSFLNLRKQCTCDSLLHEGLKEQHFSDSWSCDLAVFPNPSPAAGRWKKIAYRENATTTMISSIHEELRKRLPVE
jgi:hypothetical protein